MNIKIPYSKKRGPKPIKPYDEKTENYMRLFYNNLSEKEKRQYSAVESLKLPLGGNTYISNLFSCSINTLVKGIREVLKPELIVENRERKIGGGRKSSIEKIENIDNVFLDVVNDFMAGSPMDENIRWLNLSNKEISKKMELKGIKISVTVVKKLLKRNNFVKRKASKNLPVGSSENRNEQFENITIIKDDYMNSENPIISMDTKKKSC
jgi:hypothetical protein